MKHHLILYVICLISILSCQKDENSNTDSNYNVEQLLSDVANSKILPQINELNSEAIILRDRGDQYLQNMSAENVGNHCGRACPNNSELPQQIRKCRIC